MKRRQKIQIIGLIVLLGILLSGYFCVKIYNKPPEGVDKVKAEVAISSDKLLASFNANESSADSAYVEKVIIVEGSVKKITHINDRYTVLLQGENNRSHIICDMSESEIQSIKKLKVGDSVNIKGICKGYLMDVIMLNCILVNN